MGSKSNHGFANAIACLAIYLLLRGGFSLVFQCGLFSCKDLTHHCLKVNMTSWHRPLPLDLSSATCSQFIMSILHALRLAIKMSLYLRMGQPLKRVLMLSWLWNACFWYSGNLRADHVTDPAKLSPVKHTLNAMDLSPLKDFSIGGPVLSFDIAYSS